MVPPSGWRRAAVAMLRSLLAQWRGGGGIEGAPA